MKAGLIIAATGLAGLVHGGVHTLKLQKVPLSEQLEHADITTHAKSLYKKYAGQKFMGVRPEQHKEEMFKETSIHLDKDDHPVPVSNFLNAQCLYFSHYLKTHRLIAARFFRNRDWYTASNLQGRPRHRLFQPLGPVDRVWFHRLLSPY